MKVLLVNPPARRFVRVQYPSFPLGLGYVAATLRQRGHDVELYDAEWGTHYDTEVEHTEYPLTFMARNWHRYFDALQQPNHRIWKEVSDVIAQRKPDVLGITCRALDLASARVLARMAKDVNPKIIVVFGGPATSTCVDSILADPNVDFAVRGEGEWTTVELIETLEQSSPNLAAVNGLSWKAGWRSPVDFARRNGSPNGGGVATLSRTLNILNPTITAAPASQIIHNPQRERIEDISSLPFPARDALLYSDTLPPRKLAHMMGEMVTSRGCPFPCTFCAVNTVWGSRKSRLRQAEDVVNEVFELKERYNSRFFTFWDDLFVQSRKRTAEICRLLIERQANIEWVCLVRANTINDDIVSLMKEAGCVQMQMGVESGSERILSKMDKMLTLSQIREGAALIKRHGLSFHCFLMMGVPTETRAEIEQTMGLIDEFEPDVVEMSVFSPYPGIPLYTELESQGLVTEEDGLTADFLNVGKCFAEGFSVEEFREYALEKLMICDEHNHRMAQKARAVRTISKGFDMGGGRSQAEPVPPSKMCV